MPDVRTLTRLRALWSGNCEYRDLWGLSNATAFESLCIFTCDKLGRLPDFERLPKLTALSATRCDTLRDCSSDSRFCTLKTLNVDGSSSVKVVRDLEAVTGL